MYAYKTKIQCLAPHYLADMCRPVSSVDAKRRLRSAAREDLVIPRTASKFGARSFTVAAPSEWNRLPLHIRSTQSVNCFKVALKSSSPLTAPSWLCVETLYDLCDRSSAIALMRALVMTSVVLRRVRNRLRIIIIIIIRRLPRLPGDLCDVSRSYK